MLVLNRKPLEAIFIGDDIKVTLLQARDGSARIGIEAPRDVSIRRSDLVDREHAAAAVASSRDTGRVATDAVFSDSAESCDSPAVAEALQ